MITTVAHFTAYALINIDTSEITNVVDTSEPASAIRLVKTFVNVLAFVGAKLIDTLETTLTDFVGALVQVDTLEAALSVAT